MCVCPVLAPHGRPAPPAPATRLSHHQSQPHDHSRRDARAAVHLSLTTEVYAHCTGACTFFRHHTAPERDATGKTLHREARAAARRARSTLSVTRAGLLCSLHAACTAALPVLNIQPACSALRPCRLAPVCTARGARVARCAHARPHERARARALILSAAQTASLPAHTAYSTMGTHTPNDAARTPQQ